MLAPPCNAGIHPDIHQRARPPWNAGVHPDIHQRARPPCNAGVHPDIHQPAPFSFRQGDPHGEGFFPHIAGGKLTSKELSALSIPSSPAQCREDTTYTWSSDDRCIHDGKKGGPQGRSPSAGVYPATRASTLTFTNAGIHPATWASTLPFTNAGVHPDIHQLLKRGRRQRR